MLVEIHPILAQLARVRSETEQAMHTISLLDRELAEARVDVRQAELDSGRSVMEKIDGAGPILEALSPMSSRRRASRRYWPRPAPC